MVSTLNNSVVKTRKCKADFFFLTNIKNEKSASLISLIQRALSDQLTYTPPKRLDIQEPDDYQIRDIVSTSNGKIIQGVFGRCRFEQLTQGTTDGKEEDLNLKPGHGLVEKNFFLYYAELNMIIYQRNSTGSHHSKFLKYLEQSQPEEAVILEPILTRDSYTKLLSSSAKAKKIDISFTKPKDPKLYGHEWTKDAIKLVNSAGGLSARVTISVGRSNARLLDKMKHAVVTLAKDGLATVAKVTIDDEKEPIDLIADRVIATLEVGVDKNNRIVPSSIYNQLALAKDNRNNDILAFFGST